jgi:hypothetical protein
VIATATSVLRIERVAAAIAKLTATSPTRGTATSVARENPGKNNRRGTDRGPPASDTTGRHVAIVRLDPPNGGVAFNSAGAT